MALIYEGFAALVLTLSPNVPTVGPTMDLRYRCILIDHDDTAVNSTAAIHHPAHVAALKALRPGRTPPTLEEFYLVNFHGIMEYLVGELGMTETELVTELSIWRQWTTSRVPPFFPGFLELLGDYRQRGGKIAVVSHSETDVIAAHYTAAQDPPFLPDLIFGWESDAEKRKPSPWPAQEALRQFGCAPGEALIVDDLKPGVLMSKASGVPVAAAGWAHRVAEIETYMRANASLYCSSVAELRAILLGDDR
jgi:phosphoglycolate phosphatase/pyrophosphatase PpaX